MTFIPKDVFSFPCSLSSKVKTCSLTFNRVSLKSSFPPSLCILVWVYEVAWLKQVLGDTQPKGDFQMKRLGYIHDLPMFA